MAGSRADAGYRGSILIRVHRSGVTLALYMHLDIVYTNITKGKVTCQLISTHYHIRAVTPTNGNFHIAIKPSAGDCQSNLTSSYRKLVENKYRKDIDQYKNAYINRLLL